MDRERIYRLAQEGDADAFAKLARDDLRRGLPESIVSMPVPLDYVDAFGYWDCVGLTGGGQITHATAKNMHYGSVTFLGLCLEPTGRGMMAPVLVGSGVLQHVLGSEVFSAGACPLFLPTHPGPPCETPPYGGLAVAMQVGMSLSRSKMLFRPGTVG